jgi:hypothetical protein
VWTPATWQQPKRKSARYETDLTDEEWKIIQSLLPRLRPEAGPTNGACGATNRR